MFIARHASAKRLCVFMFLGPILALGSAALLDIAAGRSLKPDEGVVIAVLFGFAVSAGTWAVDNYLAIILPIPIRASLTAIVGAAFAVGLPIAIVRKMLPSETMLQLAILGAICMGVCSLLSNDWADRAGRR